MLGLSRIVLLATISAIGAAAWKDQCEGFTASIPNVELKSTYYPAGALVNLTSPSSRLSRTSLPAFCRLALTITTNTTSGNKALTEVWMPDDWNTRLLGIGNGGLSGGGYSTFSTNTGHQSSGRTGAWALNDTEAQKDFGYRAFHLSYQAAKTLTEAYYGKSIFKKYYAGCSTAGRMGLVEAQRYPEDFDGIIVGSPANPLVRLAAWGIHQTRQLLPVNGTRWIPTALWPVLKQCDGLDGVLDGVISDPKQCEFRPEAMACGPFSNTSTCLTLDQISAIKGLYADWYSFNGTFLFSRWEPGGELAYGGPFSYAAGADVPLGPDFFKYFLFSDPDWDYNTLTESDVFRAIEANPGEVNNNGYNYTAYFTGGGKLLHYVGLADPVISPGNSYNTYNSISAFTTANTNLNIDDHYRFYTVPGLYHCSGGIGANAFGATEQRTASMPPLARDPRHDVIAAMVDWVENGNAPTDITAAKYKNNNSTQGVDFTRKLCPYPQKGVYQGGDPNSSDSFVCA